MSDSIRFDLEGRSRFSTSRSPRFRTVHNAARTNLSFVAQEPEYDVIYVGRLVPEKGVHVLIQAAALSGLKWRIAVVGGKFFVPGGDEDAYVQDLYKQADANNLSVEFTGPVSPSRVVEYLSKSRVSVIPSVWEEPAGLTLLESMASPAAVVASNVGGLPEASKAGGVIFVPPSDPQALRTVVDDLLADESKRRSVASKGCQEVNNRSWKHVYEELTSV
ncbi:glycosyltransferase family 4 protein [Pseudarthrobacter oxydans]|uniref:glycosyltransferase family 4 protein n=1 Tax=Pseudarthrobacter oxydans TaxID=1671 RepID=UPI003D2CE482